MAITIKDDLNRAPVAQIADLMRKLGFGDIIRQSTTVARRRVAPLANAAQLATTKQVGLPDDARAISITRAYARTGAPGELAIVLANVTPGAGEVAVAPNGDIVVLGADSITDLDLDYVAAKGDVVVLESVAVVANVATLPPSVTVPGVIYLIDAKATVGTSTGRKRIVAPAATPTAGQAALNALKSTVSFHMDDAVTSCTVRLLVVAAKDVDSLLKSDADF